MRFALFRVAWWSLETHTWKWQAAAGIELLLPFVFALRSVPEATKRKAEKERRPGLCKRGRNGGLFRISFQDHLR